MPTILGTYSLTLLASRAAWIPGPIFQTTESVRVQAAGAVQWGSTIGSGSTIPSSPATWTGNTQIVTFAVPAGTWTAASWEIKGNYSGGSIGSTTIIVGADPSGLILVGASPFDVTSAATSNQLTDINAAAGGSLTVDVVMGVTPGTTVNVTSFTLILTGTTSTPDYALPEGGYPASYPNSHALDPPSVLQNGAWAGSALIVSNTVPISVVAIVLPDGVTPPFQSGYGLGLRPNRDTTFAPADLAAAGAIDPNQTYRIWFIFNDGVSDFSDNSGSFALTVTRYAGATTMGETLTSFIRPQFGVESSYGGGAAATRMMINLLNSGFDLNPEQTKEKSGVAGVGFTVRNSMTTEMSKGSGKMILDYRDFGYVLSSTYGAGLNTNPTGGVYQWVWQDNAFVPITPQTYAFETPTATGERAQAVTGFVWNGFKLDTERDKQTNLTSNFIAKIIADAATPSVGQNSVQVLTVNGAPAGGVAGVLVDNAPSPTWAYNAIASAVQTALRTMSAYSGCTVSGSAGGPWTVTNPTGLYIDPLVPVYTGLTGGTTPTMTVSVTTPGGMNFHSSAHSLPGDVSLSFAPDLTTLMNAPTAVTDELATAIDVGERFAPVWRQNTGDLGNGLIVQKKADEIKDVLTLTMAYNAQVATFISNSRSGTKMYARVSFVGPQIGSTGYFLSWFYDVCAVVTWKANKDSQGNIRSVDFDLDVEYDLATGFRSRWTGINDVASYAS